MAKRNQLKLLKKSVQAWNAWREKHPGEFINLQDADLGGADLGGADLGGAFLEGADLQSADLQSADLQGANLRDANLEHARLQNANLWRADLQGAHLEGANLQDANLQRANLLDADLQRVHLQGADLGGADLWGADLEGADLQGANLEGANLQDSNLQEADLRFTNLKRANLTGVRLFAAAKDLWEIEAVRCAYVFLDEEGEERFPQDRDFRPGEFEELYKQLPTFEYIFEHGFTPLDAVVMDRIVQAINEQQPEFELKLDSLQSRGQPHATFTVLHQKDVETAKTQVATAYERRIIELQAQKDQLMEVIKMLGSGGITIQTVGGDVTIKQAGGDIVAGSKEQRAITAGRDYFEQVQDQAQVTTGATAQAID